MNDLQQVNAILGSPLWGAFAAAAALCVRVVWRWLRTLPEDREAWGLIQDVKPWMIRLSGIKSRKKLLTPPGRADYLGAVILSILFASLFSVMTYVMGRYVIRVPHDWASLTMTVEGKENFLLTLDKAKGVVDQQPWEITPTTCRSQSYDDISLDLHLSPALVRTVCGNIGMEKSQQDIQKRIDETRYNKVWFSIIYLYFLVFFVFILISIFSDILLRKKAIAHHEKEKNLAYQYLT
ncbi:DUF6216 family protein [Lonsdalea quercina]|uniref:DUF6216 family protein n=1 Tax=Lonsdalea quercina TaxID=71657 RepID=UPI0039762330